MIKLCVRNTTASGTRPTGGYAHAASPPSDPEDTSHSPTPLPRQSAEPRHSPPPRRESERKVTNLAIGTGQTCRNREGRIA
jgi:hypothetical protein